jgi:hypothetical protein
MSLTQGKRTIVVVAGQVTDDAVDILFKIWDYALDSRSNAGHPGGVSEENLLPVHPDYLTGENEQAIAARRKKGVEEFKLKLLRELSAVRLPLNGSNAPVR